MARAIRLDHITLIQSQVLEALVAATGDSNYKRDRGCSAPEIHEELRKIRPRPQSEKYVRRILNDLAGQRVDGLPIVERIPYKRTVRWRILNAGVEYVENHTPYRSRQNAKRVVERMTEGGPR